MLMILAAMAALQATQGASAAAQAPDSPKPSIIEAPHWIRQPSAADFAQVYPRKAIVNERSDTVTIRCQVTAQGTLAECTVLKDERPGYGFGEAALSLAPKFLMSTPAASGASVGGATATIPLNFVLR